MKLMKWLLFNGVFAAAVYMGFVESNEGAYNVAMFIAWFTIIYSFFMLADPVVDTMKEMGRSVPAWINITYDIVITLTLVWFGAWVTAVFYLIHVFIQEISWKKIKNSE